LLAKQQNATQVKMIHICAIQVPIKITADVFILCVYFNGKSRHTVELKRTCRPTDMQQVVPPLNMQSKEVIMKGKQKK
jgi:hypothetical protein